MKVIEKVKVGKRGDGSLVRVARIGWNHGIGGMVDEESVCFKRGLWPPHYLSPRLAAPRLSSNCGPLPRGERDQLEGDYQARQ